MKHIPGTQEEPVVVPIWVLSFGDMVTNLLACFVLLLSMASSQDRLLFGAGVGSFRRVLQQYGLPSWMFSRDDTLPQRDYRKIKYPADEEPEPVRPQRVINPDDDAIRKLYEDLTKTVECDTAMVPDRVLSVRPLPIRFAPGSAELDTAAREHLENAVLDLRQNLRNQPIKIHVIGSAASTPGGGDSWLLSARRAAAAERHLRLLLRTELQSGLWELFSMGEGPEARRPAGAADSAAGGAITLALLGRRD